MKTESLEALLIDRDLGELSPEAVELLEAWQAEHPESATHVLSIRQTLETARAAVRGFPELARPESNVIALSSPRLSWSPLAWAASILVLVGGAAWLGFRGGEEATRKSVAANHREPVVAPASVVENRGPWARYALASNPRGGLTIVRRDTSAQP